MPVAPCGERAGRLPSTAPAIQHAWCGETYRLHLPPGAQSRARAPAPPDPARDSPDDRKYTTAAAAPARPPPPTSPAPRGAAGAAARGCRVLGGGGLGFGVAVAAGVAATPLDECAFPLHSHRTPRRARERQ